MAYIVPKEMPKSCNKCPFGFCTEYHPFWSRDDEKRNTKTIRCQAVKPFRETTLDIKDETFKAEWCPLVEAPAADVAEVKHGHWILTKTEHGWNCCEYPKEYTCSECGRTESKEEPYCHCGAKMDG